MKLASSNIDPSNYYDWRRKNNQEGIKYSCIENTQMLVAYFNDTRIG